MAILNKTVIKKIKEKNEEFFIRKEKIITPIKRLRLKKTNLLLIAIQPFLIIKKVLD